jgi:hypothetical protein
MKLGMLLTPIVALTAAGWLGMEGYYMATGQCPLSGCSEDAAMGAQPATLSTAEGAIGGQPMTSGGDACCAPKLPALTALAPGGSMTDAPGAIAPNAPTSPTDSCCPAPMAAIGTTTPAPSDGAIPMHPTTPSEGACGPNDVCGPKDCESKKPAAPAATGLETPSAAMGDCGPTDCDAQGGCCSGEAAAVDTQTPTMPATPRN